MPVDFKIKNSKIQAVGALALIMHARKWLKVILAKSHRQSSTEQLGPSDYGVYFTGHGVAMPGSGVATGITGSGSLPQSNACEEREHDTR